MPDGGGFVRQFLVRDIFLHRQDVQVVVLLLQDLGPAEGDLISLVPVLQDGLQHLAGLRVHELLIGQLAQVGQRHPAAFPGILRRDGVPVRIEDALGMPQGIAGFLQLVEFFDRFVQCHAVHTPCGYSTTAGRDLKAE